MKVPTIITATLAALLMLAPAVVVAQGYPGGNGRHGGGGFGEGGVGVLERMLPRLAERLELSDEQQAEITAIVEKELTPIRDLMEQAMAARQEFHETHTMGEFDEVGHRIFFEEQARLGVEIHLATARTWAQVFVLLTPEQQEFITQMRSHAGQGFGDGFGRRSGGRRSR